jgi:hypothetical protein
MGDKHWNVIRKFPFVFFEILKAAISLIVLIALETRIFFVENNVTIVDSIIMVMSKNNNAGKINFFYLPHLFLISRCF